LCGWQEGDIPQAQPRTKAAVAYRRKCPQCGTLVISEELIKKGCFVCGYKPEAEVK